MRERTKLLVCLVVFLGFVFSARGEDFDKEKFERRLKLLERRINYLEKRISSNGVSRADLADSIEKRLKQLESKYDKLTAPNTFYAYWKDGLRLETRDKSFQLKIGGRIQVDYAWFSESDLKGTFGDMEDGIEMRRSRIYIAGTIYKDIIFKAQYDFTDGDADFNDVWIGLKNVPYVGHIKVGHFKEPMGLELQTSGKYTTFMERALPIALLPGRNQGVMIYDTAFDERMTWAVGVFKVDTNSYGDEQGDGGYAYTGRITYLPWYGGKDKLLHLGVSFSHRSPEGHSWRYRERPESHQAPRLVDTGTFTADHINLIGLESALVYGPFSLQSEYIHAIVEAREGGCLQGFYIMGSYFLTGEHRPYSRKTGAFGRVRPKKNFTNKPGGGKGAWELAARYSYLNLSDGEIDGGRLQDFTFGINWYLNPNVRMKWNYVFANRGHLGDMNILQMRVEIDF